MPHPIDTPNDEELEEPRSVAHPSLVLGAYADELVVGSRVAVFGDATLQLPFELIERGARIVHVYDLDPTRLAEATAQGHERSLYFGSLRHHGDIGVRDGAFDVAFVPDLSFHPDPEELIKLIRRVLSSLGAAVIASPNPEARNPLVPTTRGPGKLGYYELYEAISRHFPRVRMLGQVPFVGYAMAEFSADASAEPEPTINSSLVAEEREPEWFVALASSRGLRLESYELVEVPWTDTNRGLPPTATEQEAAPTEACVDQAELDELRRERDEARAALEREVKARQHEARAREEDARALELEARARGQEAKAREQEAKAREQEHARANRADQRTAELELELSVLRKREQEVRQQLVVEEERRSVLASEIEALRKDPEPNRLREQVAQLESQVASLAAEQEQEVGQLEAQLQDRGRQIADLRAELLRREWLVREMLASGLPAPTNGAAQSASAESPCPQAISEQVGIEGASPDGGAEPKLGLHAQLDVLAREVSQREADLVAAGWKIAQLERQLGQLQR